MLKKKSFSQIIAEKPDIFGNIPETILPAEAVEELNNIPRLAIGEITGVQSLTGLFESLTVREVDALLPTVVYSGTEYGSWNSIAQRLLRFKKECEKQLKIYVAKPVILGAPQFWWALNGRFIKELFKRFKFYTPCFGCKLYAYAVRVPLCKKLNARLIISTGRRNSGAGLAVHETQTAIKYYRNFLASFGIELFYDTNSTHRYDEKLKTINSNHEDNHDSALHCSLAENYAALDSTFEEPPHLNLFFETFAVPAAAKVLSKVLSGKDVDYLHEVADTLLPVKKITAQNFKHLTVASKK